MAVLISGRAVAAARNVAPKRTPFRPQSSASALPLCSRTPPAASVTIAQMANATIAPVAFPVFVDVAPVDCAGGSAGAGVPSARSGRSRTLESTRIPRSQIATIAISPMPSRPMLALSGRTALIMVTPTTAITSRPSSAGTRELAAEDRGRSPRTNLSAITSTKVCMATPPMRLPAAMPRSPLAAAETVMASSGRLPTIESRIMPPSASPKPKWSSSKSVAEAIRTPATHVATAAVAKMTSNAPFDRPDIATSSPGCRGRSPTFFRRGKPSASLRVSRHQLSHEYRAHNFLPDPLKRARPIGRTTINQNADLPTRRGDDAGDVRGRRLGRGILEHGVQLGADHGRVGAHIDDAPGAETLHHGGVEELISTHGQAQHRHAVGERVRDGSETGMGDDGRRTGQQRRVACGAA